MAITGNEFLMGKVLPFPYIMRPLNNITPFTYADGMTYLEVLSSLNVYIQGMAPDVDGKLTELFAEFQAGITNAENTVIKSVDEWAASFNVFMGNINVELEGLNDSAVAANIANTQSETRTALDNVVAPINEELTGRLSVINEELTGRLSVINEELTGRLSVEEMSKYAVDDGGFNTTHVGVGALENATIHRARNNEAFGTNALHSLHAGRYNTFMGLEAGYYLDQTGYDPETSYATRNTGVGSNTQRFNRIGYNNVSLGRNSLQNNVTGNRNVSLGAGSMSGLSPIGLGGAIENQTPMSTNENIAVGTSALASVIGNSNTAMGDNAGFNLKNTNRSVAIGRESLSQLDKNTGYNGKIKVAVAWNVNFSFTTGQIVCSYASHGFSVGYTVGIKFPGLYTETQHLAVIAVDGSNFTLATSVGIDTTQTGVATLIYYTTNTTATVNVANTAIGASALGSLTGDTNYGASSFNTAIGFNSGSVNADGSPCTDVAFSTMIGANAKISGVRQLQLGAEDITVYAQQAISIRSDHRDKADIRDTEFGLNFINTIRAVDYKLDFRADYFVYDADGVVVETPTPDGSKKRDRFHHGVIAQELSSEFGGVQDHKVNGGSDVYTVAYEEFIAPLIKAVQELSTEIELLKEQLNK